MKRLVIISLLLIFSTLQATEFPNYYEDFVDMSDHAISYIDNFYPELLGLTLATSGLIWKYDESIRDNLVDAENKRFRNDLLNYSTYPAMWYGKNSKNVLVLYTGATASTYLYGKITDDTKSIQTSYIMLESMLFTGGIIEFSKMIIGRARPFKNLGDKHFKPFSHHHSMPSGHTAMAFSLATAIAMSSDEYWVKVPAYTFAVSAGLQRIGSDVHWTSDVLIGGLIGYGISKFLYNNYYDKHTLQPNDQLRFKNSLQFNIVIPL